MQAVAWKPFKQLIQNCRLNSSLRKVFLYFLFAGLSITTIVSLKTSTLNVINYKLSLSGKNASKLTLLNFCICVDHWVLNKPLSLNLNQKAF